MDTKKRYVECPETGMTVLEATLRAMEIRPKDANGIRDSPPELGEPRNDEIVFPGDSFGYYIVDPSSKTRVELDRWLIVMIPLQRDGRDAAFEWHPRKETA